ncbi:MAG: hypothetical protein ACJ71N_08280 [Terriglobales bacterium]|jgi:peptidoglycan/LPS O-acetylase OafA/YrhL
MRKAAFHRSFISQAIFAVVTNAIIFAIAGLSWRFFEKPILSLKEKFQYREPGIRTAAGVP